jgi:hypothetical protein
MDKISTGKIDKSTIIDGNFNTFILVVDVRSR